MDAVEKDLEKTGKLEELDVRHEAVKCAVYRFIGKLLGVSTRFSLFSLLEAATETAAAL